MTNRIPVNYILETQRLTLREFAAADAPFIIRLVNSPGWLRYIGNKNVHTEEQAIQYLQNGPLKSYQENGFGLSLVQRKSDGVSLGMCGLIKRTFLNDPDIGFAFLPEHSGLGYACEIASATMEHATQHLNIKTILAVVMEQNEKSRKLLEKIGLRYLNPIQFPGESETLMLYSTNHSS